MKENPIKLEKCTDVLCDWRDFINIYRDKLECNFDELCQVGSSSGSGSNGDDDVDGGDGSGKNYSDLDDRGPTNVGSKVVRGSTPQIIFYVAVIISCFVQRELA